MAVTRAKYQLILNASLRDFLTLTAAWNSVYLRGVCTQTGALSRGFTSTNNGATIAAAPPRPAHVLCALCQAPANVGGGGRRSIATTASRQQAYAAARTSPDDVWCTLLKVLSAAAAEEGTRGGGYGQHGGAMWGVTTGLLYAESGSLQPLCCWCVETGSTAFADIDEDEYTSRDAPSVRTFPYARVLMRGLDRPG